MSKIDVVPPNSAQHGEMTPQAAAARRTCVGYRHFNENFIGSWLWEAPLPAAAKAVLLRPTVRLVSGDTTSA